MVLLVEQVCILFPHLYFCIPEGPPVNAADLPVDAFKAMGKLPEIVAAYTSSECATYVCSDASRMLYDTKTKQVKYMWYFHGLNGTREKSARFDLQFGDAMDKPWYYIDGDTCHNYTGHVTYSDYRTCMVVTFPFPPDDVCVLWMKKWAATSTSQHCLDAFHKTCGKGYADFKPELCNGIYTSGN